MTESQYSQTGCFNKHAKFHFYDGTVVTGVITTFFPDEPHTYYFVKTADMREFKEYMDRNDYGKMRQICVEVDLRNLRGATREISIVFKLKAKMTLDIFQLSKQTEILKAIQQSVNNEFSTAQKVRVGSNTLYAINVGAEIRVLMQIEFDQVIINDIAVYYSE